jgi:N-acetyltransferase
VDLGSREWRAPLPRATLPRAPPRLLLQSSYSLWMMQNLSTRLEGQIVVLEPLEARHETGLFRAAQHPEIWRWIAPLGETRESFSAWFSASLEESETRRAGVYAVISRASGEPIGSTRYHDLCEIHRRVEIGWTWLAPSAWGTGANIEAKLLILAHTFERLGCMRVEFKTDARNERSRAALAALPAQFEGIFRKHMLVQSVGVRDSAYYSVVDDEWPDVRANLEHRLTVAQTRRGGTPSDASQQPTRRPVS